MVAALTTAQVSMSSAYVGGGFGQSKFSDGCQGASGAGVSCDDAVLGASWASPAPHVPE